MNFRRLTHFIQLLMVLQGRKVLTSVGSIFIIATLGFGVIKYTGLDYYQAYLVVVVVMNFFLILNFASKLSPSFGYLHDRSKIMGEMALPVSHLERFLANLIFYFFGFLFLLILCNAVMGVMIFYLINYSLENYFEFISHDVALKALYYHFIFFCFFFAGSIYFKSAFFKTLIVMLVANIILAFSGIDSFWEDISDNVQFEAEISTSSEAINPNFGGGENRGTSDLLSDPLTSLNNKPNLTGDFLQEDNPANQSDAEIEKWDSITFMLLAFLYFLSSYFYLRRTQLK